MRSSGIKLWLSVAAAIAFAITTVSFWGTATGFGDDGPELGNAASPSNSRSAEGSPRPPNILMIIADDLGVDQVGVYGEGTQPPRTPTIDALAARGVMFRNVWSNPVCSSTRATILTGRYSFRTGVGFVARTGADLKDREHTLPEVLVRHPNAHYGTAAFGKWHLNAGATSSNDRSYLAAPIRAGFSYFRGVFENIRYSYSHWSEIKIVSVANDSTRIEGPMINSKYNTSEIVSHAGQWIRDFETQRPDDPWFVWLAFNAAHSPFHKPPAELHRGDLSDAKLTCSNFPLYEHPENLIPCYHAMIEAMDSEIGRLLNREMSAESLGRTTVIFVGDNGTIKEAASDSFLASRAKGTPYEGGINVPLVIAGARVENTAPTGGRESQVLVNTTDLFATVLELAGLDVDASVPSRYPSSMPEISRSQESAILDVESEVVLDSHSLLPVLQSSDPDVSTFARRFVYTELFFRTEEPEDQFPVANAIRDVRGFKLIRFQKENPREWNDEVYDLANDPLERNNLIGPKMGEEARRAQFALQEQLDGIVASGWRPHGE